MEYMSTRMEYSALGKQKCGAHQYHDGVIRAWTLERLSTSVPGYSILRRDTRNMEFISTRMEYIEPRHQKYGIHQYQDEVHCVGTPEIRSSLGKGLVTSRQNPRDMEYISTRMDYIPAQQ